MNSSFPFVFVSAKGLAPLWLFFAFSSLDNLEGPVLVEARECWGDSSQNVSKMRGMGQEECMNIDECQFAKSFSHFCEAYLELFSSKCMRHEVDTVTMSEGGQFNFAVKDLEPEKNYVTRLVSFFWVLSCFCYFLVVVILSVFFVCSVLVLTVVAVVAVIVVVIVVVLNDYIIETSFDETRCLLLFLWLWCLWFVACNDKLWAALVGARWWRFEHWAQVVLGHGPG